MNYSQIDSHGNLILSRFTDNPDTVVTEGHRLVLDVPPEFDRETQYLSRLEPVTGDVVQYIINDRDDLPTLEQFTANARYLRQILLSACDWTVATDSPLDSDTKNQWIQYRQLLRDITQQQGYPQEISWPVPPTNIDIIFGDGLATLQDIT